MWIRAEYVRFKLYLDKTENIPIVVTGQPGIGESNSDCIIRINYMKVKPVCLNISLRIAFVNKNQSSGIMPGGFWNLFEDGQVYLVDEAVVKKDPDMLRLEHKNELLKDLWILTDSKDAEQEIPRWVTERGLIPKFVFASSPIETRWKKARQGGFWPGVVYMNPWSREEARLLYVIVKLTYILWY